MDLDNPVLYSGRPPLALVLAGGRGQRLEPLTLHRSKPAVPFGGRYRIVDFVLSNLVNSNIHAIYVLTQYKAQSLLQHLHHTWMGQMGRDAFITPVPAQMQSGTNWYQGNADAIYQNLDLIRNYRSSLIVVFGADHIYKMDVRRMMRFHVGKKASATVACIPIPIGEASSFGVVQVDEDWRVTGFEEKPDDPSPIPGRPGYALVSMGNYCFQPELLYEVLQDDAGISDSEHDFGRSIFPKIFQSERVFAYDFHQNQVPGETALGATYWRDVGTIDAYYTANMDLRSIRPALNLYNWNWPILSGSHMDPPAKFVFDEGSRKGAALQSIVSSGSILAGCTVRNSLIGRNVFVDDRARVERSIIMDNVKIGAGAVIVDAILDKNVTVAPKEVIGGAKYELRQGEVRSKGGIVALPKAPESPESLARG